MLFVRPCSPARVASAFLAAFALLIPASHAPAQPCGLSPAFAPGLTLPSTQPTNITTNAFVVHNDGRGPAMYVLGTQGFSYGYLGSPDIFSCVGRLRAGRFERVGYSTVGEAIAGASADLGNNLPGGPRLYVAGRAFRGINSNNTSAGPIAMWDGANWQSLPNTPSSSAVQAIQAFDDGQGGGTQLYFAGAFNVNGQPSLVVRWNGSVWQSLPLPAPGGANTTGYDFAVFDDGSGPALYLAGSFSAAGQSGPSGLAKWNGSSWTLIPGPALNGILTSVEAFTGPQGPALYVGGTFSLPDDVSRGIARRNPDGSWSSIGVPTSLSGTQNIRLSVLPEPGGPTMYIGGLSVSGGFTSGGYIRYNGVTATTPARTYGFFNGFTASGIGTTGPAALFDAGFGPEVWIGGSFNAFSDAVSSSPIVATSRSLLRLPAGAAPTTLPLAAGRGINLYNAGGITRTAAMRLRSNGRDQIGFFGPVVGGGGIAGASYALFDGSAWSTGTRQTTFRFSAGVESREATTGPVLLLAVNAGPVGYFPEGSSTFTPFGSGTNSFSDARSMLYFDDGNTNGPVLYVQDQNTVKRLINGQWQIVFSGTVRAMIIADLGQGPQLLISGVINGSGSVAAWNGVTFQPFGPALGAAVPISSMVVHDDGDGPNLYVGFEGSVALPSQQIANRIARLRNNAWEALGQGLTNFTQVRLALASFDDGSGPALYVAGDFNRAGPLASRGFARYRRGSWEPVLDINARTGIGTPQQELSLVVLQDALYLHGFFADTGLSLPGTLFLSDANTVVGENLVVIRRCPPACFPDLNQDGAIDQSDVDYLINAAAGGDNPTNANLDLNDDEAVDQSDIDVLINVIAGAPCQ